MTRPPGKTLPEKASHVVDVVVAAAVVAVAMAKVANTPSMDNQVTKTAMRTDRNKALRRVVRLPRLRPRHRQRVPQQPSRQKVSPRVTNVRATRPHRKPLAVTGRPDGLTVARSAAPTTAQLNVHPTPVRRSQSVRNRIARSSTANHMTVRKIASTIARTKIAAKAIIARRVRA